MFRFLWQRSVVFGEWCVYVVLPNYCVRRKYNNIIYDIPMFSFIIFLLICIVYFHNIKKTNLLQRCRKKCLKDNFRGSGEARWGKAVYRIAVQCKINIHNSSESSGHFYPWHFTSKWFTPKINILKI